MGKRWFHMTALTQAKAEKPCQAQHEATGRGALSVAANVTGTECVIKVAGADKEWRRGQSWIGDCIAIYDEDNHDGLVKAMSSIEWRGVDPAEIPI